MRCPILDVKQLRKSYSVHASDVMHAWADGVACVTGGQAGGNCHSISSSVLALLQWRSRHRWVGFMIKGVSSEVLREP